MERKQFMMDRAEEKMICPSCGKPSLVELGNHRYACIGCDFRRDLNLSSHHHRGGGSLIGGMVVGALILLFAL